MIPSYLKLPFVCLFLAFGHLDENYVCGVFYQLPCCVLRTLLLVCDVQVLDATLRSTVRGEGQVNDSCPRTKLGEG